MIKKHLLLAFILMPLLSFAKTYKLDGTIGGLYPIVIELEEHDDGLFSGRYAYKSTLKNKGNIDSSWLNINPNYKNPATTWDIRDHKWNDVESWYNIKFNGGKRLTCKMKNAKGKIYDVTATVTESSNNSPSWLSYFKSHIGESPAEFSMFFDPSIQQRLGNLMGNNNFDYMTSIYQTQGGIEYTKGMYWGSAFVAHQCCDPATVWAYDTDNNKFYVWIRKDGRDYWWSETGNIPIKFQEIVNDRF
ncbi:MAG: hypothetical protein HDS54_04235 [Barnesiella sp.]|nr:hypothetical protein [Bacteroidales bacterium]MBD5247358.1 hypothetical protein [Barnesiella sp.]MBD5258999.1 hypothetical protein [Barnesiella sp.]